MKKSIVFLFLIMAVVVAGCNENKNPAADRTPAMMDENIMKTKDEVVTDDFIYRLVTEQANYAEGDSVRMYAELEYTGDQDEITIFHASSPFYFPMTETTRGYTIVYPMTEPLVSTTLTKGKPLRSEYNGGGAYDDKDDKEFVDFMKGIMRNEFPTGTYNVTGYADFYIEPVAGSTEDDEDNKDYNMKAQIRFSVE
ncbi:hypothetical protein [Paenibacillus sp. GCM10028914]|uniref:hypothetical protein n=1 Tax=Paenibacillus sp. GCM10028914 TaxID=3273416 RepID=UPI00360FC479